MKASLLHIAFADEVPGPSGQTRKFYLDAARVPLSLQPQTFGLWIIQRTGRRRARRPVDLHLAAPGLDEDPAP
jgi:hypothetical protein